MKRDAGCSYEQLTLYHYGELAPAEHLAMERHLADCPACRAALEEVRTSLAAVPRSGLQLSAAQKLRFAEQVMARTRRRIPRSASAWGALVAAGVAGLTIMLTTTNHGVLERSEIPTRTNLELVEQLELLQELTLLQDMDLLQELEKL